MNLLKIQMKFIKYSKYRKFKNPKISYIFSETLVFFYL